MAAWLGPCLNCAVCWGCHESRRDSAGAARMVCRSFRVVEGCQMNTPRPAKAEQSALDSVKFTVPARFTGTDNPRHLRTIQALMTRPITREHLDQIAGCSNGPELIAELRRRGLNVPCTRTKKKDRDLFDCWPGVYHFTQTDRRRVLAWLTKQQGARRG